MLTVGTMLWLVGCTPDVGVGADGEGTSPEALDTTPEHAGGPGRSLMMADPRASGRPFSGGLPGSVTEDEGDAMLFGERITDVEILLDDRARGSLASDPGTDVMATLVVDEAAYVVGVHLKGRMSFRSLSEKPAFRVDMGEYIDGATLYGVRRFTLQNMVQDSSMMAEHLFHALARASGVPNPRHGYAQLRINGREKGLYGIMESADDPFLRRWFEDDEGNLYEGGWGADVRAGHADDFTLEEAGLATSAPEDLEAMVARVTRDEVAGISECFDREAVLAAWAVEITTGQADGYLTWANNFLLYGEPGGSPGCGARWTMLPWGMDQAFRSNRDPFGGAAGALADACLADAGCRNELRAATANVLVTWERLDLAGRAAETEALIQDACERDPARELPCNQERVRRWIEERPAEIREYLRE
jgi:hypothetical protein